MRCYIFTGLKRLYKNCKLFFHLLFVHSGNNHGNVLVVVALVIPILFLCIALVLDFGNLTMKHNKLQNAIDSAALAAAMQLNREPEDIKFTVLKILRDNQVEIGYENIKIEIGFYDEFDSYPDFSLYKEFALGSLEEIPEGRYPNAVIVIAYEEVAAMEVKSKEKSKAVISAHSLAYVPHYGLMALGNRGIQVKQTGQDGFPHLVDCPVHSNADIDFSGTELFEGDSPVTAVGSITDYSGGFEGADSVSLTPINWTELEDSADKVYYVEDWGDITEDDYAYYGDYQHPVGTKLFVPKAGDHNGRIYYVGFRNTSTPSAMLRLCINMDWRPDTYPDNYRAYNFTLACAGHMAIAVQYNYVWGITIGKPDDGNVYIYVKHDFFLQDRASSAAAYVFDGVFLRVEGRFDYYTHTRQETVTHRTRIVADRLIIRGVFWNEIVKTVFAPEYGPWFPALKVKLGNSELTAVES